MSRIGKKPIPIPKGVTVKIAPDAVEVQGPKGKLRQPLPPGILFSQDAGELVGLRRKPDVHQIEPAHQDEWAQQKGNDE